MLSHALLETWKRREGNTLTVAAYTASGGIRGAVAQSAERVYVSIPPERTAPTARPRAAPGQCRATEGEPVRGRVPEAAALVRRAERAG